MAHQVLENKRKFTYQENEDDLMILEDYKRIHDSNKKFHYQSFLDRYFTKYYMLDVRYAMNDHLVLLHSNKVAVCTLAPSHPALNLNKYKIKRIEFIQDVNEEMRGKHKHNANNLNLYQRFCRIYCQALQTEESNATIENQPDEENGVIGEEKNTIEKSFLIYSCMNAKLIEINERLLTNPELLQTKPETEGYLAILLPKLDGIKDQTSLFKTQEEFTKLRTNN
jgi:hypothetical protein